MSSLIITIPVKGPARSKTRLADLLSLESRTNLVLRMFERTLRFFCREFPQYPILVVTDSELMANIAQEFGASIFMESQADGLNAAASRAAQRNRAAGYDKQLLVPADIALLSTREINQLISAAEKGSSVVVSRAKDGGTNGLLTSPPDVINFSFGEQSSASHIEHAALAGVKHTLLEQDLMSRDIDFPEDLFWLPDGYSAWAKPYQFGAEDVA